MMLDQYALVLMIIMRACGYCSELNGQVDRDASTRTITAPILSCLATPGQQDRVTCCNPGLCLRANLTFFLKKMLT
jgi:hypothetical protein